MCAPHGAGFSKHMANETIIITIQFLTIYKLYTAVIYQMTINSYTKNRYSIVN